MFDKPNNHLGDCWSYVHNDRLHLFYLTCPDSVERHTFWSIGHTSTTDFKIWKDHPDVLNSDKDNPRLSCLSTGSIVRYKGRFLFCFCGNHNSPDPALSFASSEDLDHWTFEESIPPIPIDGEVYTKRGSVPFKNPRWRDPFLFIQENALYILVCGAVESAPTDRDGVIAVLKSTDLETWDYLPPLDLPQLGSDLECPKLHHINGRWHLVISMFDVLKTPEFKAIQPKGLNENTSFVLTADDWRGPFKIEGHGRLYTRGPEGCPYANEVFEWKNAWHAIGTCWSEHRPDFISQPTRLNCHPSGLSS